MPENKLNAQERFALSLGMNILEVETMRDRIEQLTAQISDRDATIRNLLAGSDAPPRPAAAKPARSKRARG
jgi:hypothetical protein